MFWGVFGYGGSRSRHRPARRRLADLPFRELLGWYFTPLASNWGTIDFTVDVTFWVCGIVFVAVNLFTAYCVWRFRARPGNKAHYEPESTKLEIVLTAFTTVGVAAMLTPGLFVWADFVQVPEDASDRRGRRQAVALELPACRARDNELGASDVRHMSVDNPLGVDPEDPAGPGRHHHRERRSCTCRWISRSGRCCARPTCCTTSRCRSSA